MPNEKFKAKLTLTGGSIPGLAGQTVEGVIENLGPVGTTPPVVVPPVVVPPVVVPPVVPPVVVPPVVVPPVIPPIIIPSHTLRVNNMNEWIQLLSRAGTVAPGTVIEIRAGTYAGTFSPSFRGTPDKPIVVRRYGNERVTFDSGNSRSPNVLVKGAYTWYLGLEVMSSSASRISTISGSSGDVNLAEGFDCGNNEDVSGIKIINCIIHDVKQAVSFWKNGIGGEINGCVITNIGWSAPDRGHGHGIYAQSRSQLAIANNLVLGGMSHGIQCFGSEAAPLENIRITDNVMAWHVERTFLFGGGQPMNGGVFSGNISWAVGGAGQFGLGQGGVIKLNGNLFVSPSNQTALRTRSDTGEITFLEASNNRVYGSVEGPDTVGGLTKLSAIPDEVILKPSIYETKRGHITVINGSKRPSVVVNLAGFGFKIGDQFKIVAAHDYYGVPVVTGAVGATNTIPLGARQFAKLIGDVPAQYRPVDPAPLHAFVVMAG